MLTRNVDHESIACTCPTADQCESRRTPYAIAPDRKVSDRRADRRAAWRVRATVAASRAGALSGRRSYGAIMNEK